jgi:4-amino-4-deoxy-L-arabinose transferase-like glycosyltransferase
MEMFGLIFAFLMLMAFSILLSVAVGFTTRRRPKRLAFTLSALVAPTLLVSLWLTGCYTLQEAHSVMGRKHFWFFEGVCPLVNGYDFTFDAKFNTGYIAKHGVELSRPPVWDRMTILISKMVGHCLPVTKRRSCWAS